MKRFLKFVLRVKTDACLLFTGTILLYLSLIHI